MGASGGYSFPRGAASESRSPQEAIRTASGSLGLPPWWLGLRGEGAWAAHGARPSPPTGDTITRALPRDLPSPRGLRPVGGLPRSFPEASWKTLPRSCPPSLLPTHNASSPPPSSSPSPLWAGPMSSTTPPWSPIWWSPLWSLLYRLHYPSDTRCPPPTPTGRAAPPVSKRIGRRPRRRRSFLTKPPGRLRRRRRLSEPRRAWSVNGRRASPTAFPQRPRRGARATP